MEMPRFRVGELRGGSWHLALGGIRPQRFTAVSALINCGLCVVSGAVIMGRLSDLSSIATAMIISGPCFIVAGAFALSGRRTSPAFMVLAEQDHIAW